MFKVKPIIYNLKNPLRFQSIKSKINFLSDRDMFMLKTKYFLQKTQIIDEEGNNACPSAHVVFAMYSFYLLKNVIGYIPALLIPILILISCISTTQHVSIDIIFGIIYSILFYNFILKKILKKYLTSCYQGVTVYLSD